MNLRSLLSNIRILVILLILVSQKMFSQETGHPFKLMFYNVENAFDTTDDTLTNDEEFLPGGLRRWNQSRYKKKIAGLYKTIMAAGEWTPPEIVAFCEVENRKVLEDLVYGTYLSKFNYGIIHEESPDRRGIDVCLIYRKDIVSVAAMNYWIPSGISRDEFGSRSVLYAGMVFDSDTVHIIVNHWPSRKGGVLAGGELRMKIASMVREKADSIFIHNKDGAKIIIAGDFNCTPDGLEMKSFSESGEKGIRYVNLSADGARKGIGTYRYMGVWEMIDQVLVSGKLLNCDTGVYIKSKTAEVFNADFLVSKDQNYPGYSPFSMYRGYRYQGGFSDHLPVLVNLHLKVQPE